MEYNEEISIWNSHKPLWPALLLLRIFLLHCMGIQNIFFIVPGHLGRKQMKPNLKSFRDFSSEAVSYLVLALAIQQSKYREWDQCQKCKYVPTVMYLFYIVSSGEKLKGTTYSKKYSYFLTENPIQVYMGSIPFETMGRNLIMDVSEVKQPAFSGRIGFCMEEMWEHEKTYLRTKRVLYGASVEASVVFVWPMLRTSRQCGGGNLYYSRGLAVAHRRNKQDLLAEDSKARGCLKLRPFRAVQLSLKD